MDEKFERPDEARVMFVSRPMEVHSYDVDFMGIVNNTVYVKWLEDLRMAILDKYYPLSRMLADDCSPILAETSIRYSHPVGFGSNPVGECRIWLTGRSRWCAEHVIKGDGVIFATARQTGYYFNIVKRRPVPFPQQLLDTYLVAK